MSCKLLSPLDGASLGWKGLTLTTFVNYGRKKFLNVVPRVSVKKKFFIYSCHQGTTTAGVLSDEDTYKERDRSLINILAQKLKV